MSTETHPSAPIEPDFTEHHGVVEPSNGFIDDAMDRQNSAHERRTQPEKTPMKERLKALFRSEAGNDTVSSRDLVRDVEAFERQFNGLVGKVAETGTKPEYLSGQFEEYQKRLKDSDPANLEAGRVIVRELVQPLVEMKNIDDEDTRKLYEDELVDTFHRYTTLSDDDRELFHDILGARYESADKLKRRNNTPDNQEAPEEISDEERIEAKLTITKLELGGIALAIGRITENAKDYWNERKVARKNRADSKDGLLKRSAASLKLAPHKLLNDIQMKPGEKHRQHEQLLKNMTTDEREEYRLSREKKSKRYAVAAGIGAVAALGVGLYLSSRGVERGGKGHLNFNDLFPADEQQIVSGHEFELKPTSGNGGKSLDLFAGEGGSTHLTALNKEHLHDFLDTYTVKSTDTRGDWGIAEKYLKAQGIKNPSVYQIDAVKDRMLEIDPSSAILHPGDTIK